MFRSLTRLAGAGAVVGAAGYVGLVTGRLGLDLGVGRRTLPLGPQSVDIAADRGLVFDIIATPYLGRPTRAMAEKVRVLERGDDMVLAAHHTPVGRGLTAVTVETVRFTRPDRVNFRLVRGPVPHVTEQFTLTERAGGTRLDYHGEIAGDLWQVGQVWTAAVARRWEQVVADTFASVQVEAERRTTRPRPVV